MRNKGSLSPRKQVPNRVGAGALTPEPSNGLRGCSPAHHVLCTGVHLLPRALAELACPRLLLANRDHSMIRAC